MNPYPDLSAEQFLVVDTETTGVQWWKDRVFGVAIATPDGASWYHDVRDDASRRYVADTMKSVRRVVNHHIKFDLHMLRESDMPLDPAKSACTMVAAALINEHEPSYSLDSLATKYAGISKEDIWPELAKLFGGEPTRKAQIVNLPRAPKALVARYAQGDVIAALRLWEWQQAQLGEQELWPVFDVEMELMSALVEMERHGMGVDIGAANANISKLERTLGVLRSELRALAGVDLNPNSSPQLLKLLYAREEGGQYIAIDGTIMERTDSGKPSVGSETLRRMSHPLARAVTRMRSLDKAVNTFLRGHILGHQRGGRVHANYNQTRSENNLGIVTGRISINDPALQQIHKRDKEMAAIVRSCFIPDAGQDWCSIDWSQMDFRVFAHYTQEKQILDIYRVNPDADFHRVVADLTNIPRDRDASTGGGNAKQINLGLVFGMGTGRMAKEMGLPFTEKAGYKGKTWNEPGEEAKALFDKYHEAIPGVKAILEKGASLAKTRGYVKTILGRRIRFPDGSYHKAAGLVFQGSAADALKVKIVEVARALKGTGAHLLTNVHDEFDMSVPEGDTKTPAMVKGIIESFGPGDRIQFRVPIRSSVGIGRNWWEASK